MHQTMQKKRTLRLVADKLVLNYSEFPPNMSVNVLKDTAADQKQIIKGRGSLTALHHIFMLVKKV